MADWSRCPECEVWWATDDPCWFCGQPGVPAPRLHIGSQHGHMSAINESQWAEVRRQIL